MLEIVELPIPDRPGAGGWDDFVATTEVDNACQVAGYGTTDVVTTAEERLPHWHDPETGGRLIAARWNGEIVGRLADRWTREAPDAGFSRSSAAAVSPFRRIDRPSPSCAGPPHSTRPATSCTAASG